MGTSCAPHLANIFLFVYESEFINSLISRNMIDKAVLLSNIFRYQDDCFVFNDKGYFNEVISKIYPTELKLENTNISKHKFTFLDLKVTLHKGVLKYNKFDKRETFPFNVISYPFVSGNVPKIPCYGVYMSQLIRLCQVTNESKSFTGQLKTLNEKLCNQGFDVVSLKRKFIQFSHRYLHLWCKFGIDITKNEFLNNFF